MARELPSTLSYLAQNQSGVVSRSQALRAGLSPGMIKFRVHSGQWRQIHPGVYATFTGELTRRTGLWAAVLSAGPGAALSYETAAELQRLADKPAGTIHVTVPYNRRVAAVEGVSLHRSARVVEAVQGHSYPPRTKVEETVLDLTQTAATFDDLCGWVTRAFAGPDRRGQPADGDDLAEEAAVARGLGTTHHGRCHRRPFGAGISL